MKEQLICAQAERVTEAEFDYVINQYASKSETEQIHRNDSDP